MTANSKALRSGDVARLVGVSPDTLRLYERKGLLKRPLRSQNGYRCYPPEAIDRIRVIRAALSIGFTLDELAEILKARDNGGIPCQQVRTLAGTKLRNLESHIKELVGLRAQLRRVLKQWDGKLGKTTRGQRAGLLEALVSSGPPMRKAAQPFHSPFSRKPGLKEPKS